MGYLELALLEYYRLKNVVYPKLMTLQEITEWLWLEYKFGIEQIEKGK